MKRIIRSSRFALLPLALAILVIGPALYADNGPQHRVSSNLYGVSGGNVNDRSNLFCCSGTLGALVTDGIDSYILSNNHVLARSNAGVIGDQISQPGMIDVNCGVTEVVANLSAFASLGSSNVDAAVAKLIPGAMSATGEILDIGQISSIVKAPTVGLAVQKSGRTTGRTTGTVSSTNTSVSVQYQQGCGKGKKFTVSYTGQVVINSSSFSAGGDSGSLIVTNNACAQPVALLYAGSSTSTIGNPIGEVLTRVGQAFNPDKTLLFVGGVCTASAQTAISDGAPSDAAVGFATAAMRTREKQLMSRRGVIGIGVGSLDSNNAEAAIVIYVDKTADTKPRLPRQINGVRVRVVETDPFVAY